MVGNSGKAIIDLIRANDQKLKLVSRIAWILSVPTFLFTYSGNAALTAQSQRAFLACFVVAGVTTWLRKAKATKSSEVVDSARVNPTPSDIRFPSGRQGHISSVTGIVFGFHKWTETHLQHRTQYHYHTSQIYHWGGAGSTPGTSTVVTSTPYTSIHSTNIDRQEFWIRTRDGRDIQYKLKIPITEGQTLTLAWCTIKDQSALVYWKNCSSRFHGLFSADANDKEMTSITRLLLLSKKCEDKTCLFSLLALLCGSFAGLMFALAAQIKWDVGILSCAILGLAIGSGISKRFKSAVEQRESRNNQPKLLSICDRSTQS